LAPALVGTITSNRLSSCSVSMLAALIVDVVATVDEHLHGRVDHVAIGRHTRAIRRLDADRRPARKGGDAGVVGIEVAIVADLDAGLNEAVATKRQLTGRTLIKGVTVAVVALLADLHDPAATAAGQAHGIAAVGLVVVAIIAHLDAVLHIAAAAAGRLAVLHACVGFTFSAIVTRTSSIASG
jgi:hypothetical protein